MDLLATFTWLLMLGLTPYFAKQRGRNPWTWFFLGFLFGIFSLIALFLMPDLSEESEKKSENVENARTETAEPPQFQSIMPEKEWFYVGHDVQQGPISQVTFDQLKADGVITEQTLVWSEGMSDWQKLSECNDKRVDV